MFQANSTSQILFKVLKVSEFTILLVKVSRLKLFRFLVEMTLVPEEEEGMLDETTA